MLTHKQNKEAGLKEKMKEKRLKHIPQKQKLF